MPYVITDTGKFLTIKLKTSFEQAKYLDFKRNGSAVSQRTANPAWSSDAPYQTWQIPLYSWRVGDVLSDFTVSSSVGTYKLADMNEGITWFLDGEEIANNHSETITFRVSDGTAFTEVGEHTIQAVWAGNKMYSTAKTPKKTFYVKPTSGESTPVSQVYHINYLDLNEDTFKYGDTRVTLKVKLTQGGVPVGGADVLLTSSRGYTCEGSTDANGVAELKLNSSERAIEVGSHVLYTTYTMNDAVQCSCQRKVNIIKDDPLITYVRQNNSGQSSGWHIRDEIIIRWQEPNGKSMNDAFFPVYINGKLYTVQTNRNGRAWIRLTNTGTYRFKAVYQGNKNMNAYQKDWTLVVS